MNKWEVDDKPNTDGIVARVYQTTDGEDVADVLTTRQDAVLMAAAPELRAALLDLLAATDRVCVTHGEVTRLDAAREHAREALRRTR